MTKTTQKHYSKNRPAASSQPPGAQVMKQLGSRLGKWLLRLLWRQVKWWLWIGGFLAASYGAMFLRYMWAGSILLWIAIFIFIAWIMSIFKSDDDHDGHYDEPRKRGETWRQRELRETQEMFDDHQREREDQGLV